MQESKLVLLGTSQTVCWGSKHEKLIQDPVRFQKNLRCTIAGPRHCTRPILLCTEVFRNVSGNLEFVLPPTRVLRPLQYVAVAEVVAQAKDY